MADESKYPTRIAPYGLRMPPELKERVEAAAKANNRSMNAEIVSRLAATFDVPSKNLENRILNPLSETDRLRMEARMSSTTDERMEELLHLLRKVSEKMDDAS